MSSLSQRGGWLYQCCQNECCQSPGLMIVQSWRKVKPNPVLVSQWRSQCIYANHRAFSPPWKPTAKFPHPNQLRITEHDGLERAAPGGRIALQGKRILYSWRSQVPCLCRLRNTVHDLIANIVLAKHRHHL